AALSAIDDGVHGLSDSLGSFQRLWHNLNLAIKLTNVHVRLRIRGMRHHRNINQLCDRPVNTNLLAIPGFPLLIASHEPKGHTSEVPTPHQLEAIITELRIRQVNLNLKTVIGLAHPQRLSRRPAQNLVLVMVEQGDNIVTLDGVTESPRLDTFPIGTNPGLLVKYCRVPLDRPALRRRPQFHRNSVVLRHPQHPSFAQESVNPAADGACHPSRRQPAEGSAFAEPR